MVREARGRERQRASRVERRADHDQHGSDQENVGQDGQHQQKLTLFHCAPPRFSRFATEVNATLMTIVMTIITAATMAALIQSFML